MPDSQVKSIMNSNDISYMRLINNFIQYKALKDSYFAVSSAFTTVLGAYGLLQTEGCGLYLLFKCLPGRSADAAIRGQITHLCDYVNRAVF